MSSTDNCVALELSRAESWVVHAALLARIGRETESGNDVNREIALLRAVEHGEYTFDPADLDLLRTTLSAYLADAPERDRIPGQAMLDEIDGAVA